MRAVLDTNVLVSAAIAAGPSYRIMDTWFENAHFELILCPSLLAELEDVLLNREHLRRWIDVDAARLYVARLSTTAELHDDPSSGPSLTRDPDDDFLIYLARESGAEVIVSGDADLSEWAEQVPPVVTPRSFERLLAEAS